MPRILVTEGFKFAIDGLHVIEVEPGAAGHAHAAGFADAGIDHAIGREPRRFKASHQRG